MIVMSLRLSQETVVVRLLVEQLLSNRLLAHIVLLGHLVGRRETVDGDGQKHVDECV